MKVLLSIKPEYAEKILQGEKRFEFRKSLFKNKDITTVIIYATMPVGKVVGEFDLDGILSDSPKKIWLETSDYSGITRQFFDDYFNGKKLAHAIKVGEVRRYDIPLNLNKIVPNGLAPQSFRYLR